MSVNTKNMMASVHKPKYNVRVAQVTTDAVILPKRDFKRIRNESIHLTAAQQMTLSQEMDAKRKTEKRTVKDRRTTLLEAEQAKQARQRELETQREMEERDYQLKVAEAKGNEELDEVKTMNAEMMLARVRTMRDHQILMNQQRRQREREEEEAMARMLEENRQRALAIYAERERLLNEQRRRGGEVILSQIEEKRENQRIENERRELEKQETLRANAKAREDDLRLLEEKKRRSETFLAECMEANRLALKRKQQEKEREIEENMAIVEYNREKAEREEAYEAKVRAQKQQKELEIAEVRKLQQRALDTRAQEDELRARRIEEELQRKDREREIARRKREVEALEERRKDREQAILLKKKRIIELAKIEKAEFERIQAAQRAQKEKDRIEAEKRRKREEEYKASLIKDIEARREEKRLQPIVHLDEQKHQEELQQDYRDRLERIRQMKLDQLRSEGVPEKYLADLKNMRFVVK